MTGLEIRYYKQKRGGMGREEKEESSYVAITTQLTIINASFILWKVAVRSEAQ